MKISENPEIQNQKRITNTIYFSLVIGLLVFFIIVIFLIQDKKTEGSKDLDMIFTFIVPYVWISDDVYLQNGLQPDDIKI